MNFTKKGDFVEIKFTGYHDGKVFDSNIGEDLKTINPEAKPEKTIVIIGEGMVVKGLDKSLEEKELNKEYKINIPYKDGFGERKRELVKTIPLKVFTEQKINPSPGQALVMDNMIARIITVSGARVVTDFNNPLAGKDLEYKFTINRILQDQDEKEKLGAFFKFFLHAEPDLEINEKSVTIKAQKPMKFLVEANKEKFKKIFNKDLKFQELKDESAKESKEPESK